MLDMLRPCLESDTCKVATCSANFLCRGVLNDKGEVLLLMSNRRIFHKGSQHSEFNMVDVFRGSRFPPEQRREDGDQANAH